MSIVYAQDALIESRVTDEKGSVDIYCQRGQDRSLLPFPGVVKGTIAPSPSALVVPGSATRLSCPSATASTVAPVATYMVPSSATTRPESKGMACAVASRGNVPMGVSGRHPSQLAVKPVPTTRATAPARST